MMIDSGGTKKTFQASDIKVASRTSKPNNILNDFVVVVSVEFLLTNLWCQVNSIEGDVFPSSTRFVL